MAIALAIEQNGSLGDLSTLKFRILKYDWYISRLKHTASQFPKSAANVLSVFKCRSSTCSVLFISINSTGIPGRSTTQSISAASLVAK